MEVLAKIKKYKDKVAEIERNRAVKQGQFDAEIAAVKRDFSVDTIEAVQDLQKQKAADAASLGEEFEKLWNEFEALYAHILETV